nr:hypothetical protein [Mycoplasmopsis bovis]
MSAICLYGKLNTKFIWSIYFLIKDLDDNNPDIDNNGFMKKLTLVRNIIISPFVSLFLMIKKVDTKMMVLEMFPTKILLNRLLFEPVL